MVYQARTTFAIVVIFFSGLFIVPSPALTEDKVIALDDCIKIALQNHPDLLVAQEDSNISLTDYQISKANRSIIINGQVKSVERLKANSSSDSNFRIPGKDTDIGLFAGLSANYTIFDSKKEKMEESAKIGVNLAKAQFQFVTDDIIFNVKKAYYEYLYSKDTLDLMEKLLEKFKEKKILSKKLYENGLRPLLDVSKADVGVAQATLDYEKAKNDERIKRSDLYTAMGIKGEMELNVASVSKENLPPLKYSIDEINKLAILYNPEVRAMALQRDVSKINIAIENEAHYPKVDIVFALGYENKILYLFNSSEGKFSDNFKGSNWEPVFTGTMTASIPVYYGGAISAKVDAAKAQYNKMVYKEREILLNLKKNIENYIADLNELDKQAKMSQLIIDNSKEHALLASKSYEKGIGTLLDLQEAEMGVIRSELSYLAAIYKYYLSLALLARTAGVEEETLCK